MIEPGKIAEKIVNHLYSCKGSCSKGYRNCRTFYKIWNTKDDRNRKTKRIRR